MNKAMIIGNLTKDPDLRTTSNTGTSVCSFTVAVNRRFKGQNGENEADFIPIVVWRGLADNCAKYLRKGSQVAVAGAIQTRSYDGQDGKRVYITEIIGDDVQFLARTAGSEGNQSSFGNNNNKSDFQKPQANKPAQAVNNAPQEIEDDDLPF